MFKLKDPKVQQLRTGKLSVKGFSLLVAPSDPYVLIGDTIYALTEQEYYALRAVLPLNVLTEQAFHYVLNMEDLSFMQEQDRAFIDKVKKDMPNCTACKYKRYKDEVYKLIKKYGIQLPPDIAKGLTAQDNPDRGEYPETTGEVAPAVFALTDHMYHVEMPTRKPCIDCVEKHLSQAYVLSKEFLQGYPEYISLVVGHLGEAIEELPKEFSAFKDTLEFCLAKTNYDRVPFVPINLLIPHINMSREALKQSIGEQQDVDASNTLFELDLTDDAKTELKKVEGTLARRFVSACISADNFTLRVEKVPSDVNRISWEGAMACAADLVASIAPSVSNIIRNRRLMFHVNPVLCKQSGYMLKDIVKVLLENDAF